MPAHPPPARGRWRRFVPTPGHPPRAILNAVMALAVIVLERRIRKALSSRADVHPVADTPGRLDLG